MKKVARIALAIALMAWSSLGWANSNSSISDAILQNEIRLTGSQSVDEHSILVVVSLNGRYRRLRRDFVTALVRTKISTAGYKTLSYSGDFASDFDKSVIAVPLLLTPKLVIEIDNVSTKEAGAVALKCSLSFVDYRPSSDKEDYYIPKSVWAKNRDFKGDTTDELETLVIEYVQKEVSLLQSQILKKRMSEKYIHQRRTHTQSASGKTRLRGLEHTALSYSLKWNDPDNRRNNLFFGASAGTPALLNLHLGFWGSSELPFVIGASGMYMNTERRGAQVDLGWAFDNTGEFKEVIGFAATAFSESRSENSQERDQFGRVTRTTIEKIHSLRPYLGPVYTADWNSFRFQAGAVFRMVPEAQSSMRGIISIGYAPPIGF